MMACVEPAKLTGVTWSMLVLLPLRTHPVGVPLPSTASRLVPLSNVEFGQKLFGRLWLRAKLAVSSSVAAPRSVSLEFMFGLSLVLSFLRTSGVPPSGVFVFDPDLLDFLERN